MHYIMKVSRFTNIVHIAVYLLLTCIENFFSTIYYLFSNFWWSVNCMSQVSKSHNVFPTCSETEARLIFKTYIQFQLSSTFLAFFIWSVNCSSHFLANFCRAVSCKSRVFEFCNIFRRCPEV